VTTRINIDILKLNHIFTALGYGMSSVDVFFLS